MEASRFCLPERSIHLTISSSQQIPRLFEPSRKCLDEHPVAGSHLADAILRPRHGGCVVSRRGHPGCRVGPRNVLCDRVSHSKNDGWHYDEDSYDYCHDDHQQRPNCLVETSGKLSPSGIWHAWGVRTAVRQQHGVHLLRRGAGRLIKSTQRSVHIFCRILVFRQHHRLDTRTQPLPP